MLNYASDDRRDVKTAMHWQTPDCSRRPGPVYSYIIIECEDAAGFIYHQGVRLYSSNVGKPADCVWFWGDKPISEIGIDDIVRLDTGALEMEKSTTNRTSAFKTFFGRRGFPVNTFINAKFDDGRHDCVYKYRQVCRSLLDNKNIGVYKTLSEYVRKQIFPGTSTEMYVEDISKAFESVNKMKRELEINTQRLRIFESICGACNAWREADHAAKSADLLLSYLFLEHSRELKVQYSEQYEQFKDEYDNLSVSLSNLNDELADKHEKRGAIKSSSQAIMVAENAYNVAKKDFERLSLSKDRYDAFVDAFNALADFFEDEDAYPEIPDDMDWDEGVEVELVPDNFEQSKKIIELALDNYSKDINRRNVSIEEFKKNIADKELDKSVILGKSSIDGSGDSKDYRLTMLNEARRLKEVIARNVPGSNPEVLCDCVVSVSDPEWQKAIETLIGENRFGIVVAPEYYNDACRVQHAYSGQYRTVILDLRTSGLVASGSIVNQLEYNNDYAKAYVDANYGSFVMCETDADFANAKKGVRKDGQIKYTNRSVKNGSSRDIVCVFGHEAMRIACEKLDDEIKVLNRQISAINRMKQKSVDCRARLSSLRDDLYKVSDAYKPEIIDEYAVASRTLEKAKENYDLALRSDDANRIEKQLADLDVEIASLEVQIADVQNRVSDSRNKYTNAQTMLDRSEHYIEDYGRVVPEGFVLTDMDKSLISRCYLDNVPLGKESKDRKIAELTDVANEKRKAAQSALDSAMGLYGNLRVVYSDMPVSINNEADCQWFDMKYSQLKKSVDISNLAESVDNLNEALKNTYVNVLNVMSAEYRNAQDVRESFNNVLSKYKIGMCRYRIGPIGVNHSKSSVPGFRKNLLEIAIELSEGHDLSAEDLDVLNGAMEIMLSGNSKTAGNLFNYVDYMSVAMQFKTDDSTEWKNADRQAKFNSNGQQTILRYILKLAVIDSLAFTQDSLRFVMVDEVLQGVDDINGRYFFQALSDMNLQAMVSSMNMSFKKDCNYTYVCRPSSKDCYVTDMSFFGEDQEELDKYRRLAMERDSAMISGLDEAVEDVEVVGDDVMEVSA
jgi:hypothetical protein